MPLLKIETVQNYTFRLLRLVIARTLFESGLYSSQDSIKISCLWTRTLFELGLYSSQASNNDSTVYIVNIEVARFCGGFMFPKSTQLSWDIGNGQSDWPLMQKE